MNKLTKLAASAIAVSGVLGMGLAAQAATVFTSNLSTAQNVGDRGADVTAFAGVASSTLELVQGEDGLSLRFEVAFSNDFNFNGIIGTPNGIPADAILGTPGTEGADVTLFHIHQAARGETGGVVFGLFGPNTDLDGDTTLAFAEDGSATLTSEWDLDEGLGAFVEELLAANTGEDLGLYFNLHSSSPDAPAGLIRGQLVAANSINAVPVPAAAALFIPALLGGAAVRRRKKAQA